MKKFLFGFISAFIIFIPILTLSAPSLSSKLSGKILLAVEDKGKTYYVNNDGKRYRVTKDTALEIFKKLALGINNDNLSQIPEGNVGVSLETELDSTCADSICDCSIYTKMIKVLEKNISQLESTECPVATCTKCPACKEDLDTKKTDYSDMTLDVGISTDENGKTIVGLINTQNVNRSFTVQNIYIKSKNNDMTTAIAEMTCRESSSGSKERQRSANMGNINIANGIFFASPSCISYSPLYIKFNTRLETTGQQGEIEVPFDDWVVYDNVLNKPIKLIY